MRLDYWLDRQHWLRLLVQHRFVKFGVVGATGTLVNLGILFVCQEYLLRAIEPAAMRLNVSLATAIFFATANNFLLNRAWTWRDRKHHRRTRSVLAQFGQYAMACWIGVALQFVLTKLFVMYTHYLLANACAIVLASLFNYALNNMWTFRREPLSETLPDPSSRPGSARKPNLYYAAAAVLAVSVYFFDLGGQNIPKNGDEFPYAQITRLTAASGHLLPLQSEMPGMRNTKPPLLFWQGIASTDGGTEWTLWNLRYPSVIYTLLTALLCYLLTNRLTGERGKGILAALIYLAFFSTYRYGRPFLTNAPEVFWLFMPFFLLIYWPHAFVSRTLPLLIGVMVGVGLLYKSFALLLPVGFSLAWWYLHEHGYKPRVFLRSNLWRLSLVAFLSLALFSLWFAFDPQPQDIWREFVVGENAGKFKAGADSYLRKLVWGTSSFWTLLLGFPMNAGLLALPVFGVMLAALRRPSQLSREEKLLWMVPVVFLFVFSLPSQRSARYLLDAMPAVAVLAALAWDRLGRLWFWLSLILIAAFTMLLAYLAWSIQAARPDLALFGAGYGLFLLAILLFIAVVAFRADFARSGTVLAGLLALLALAGFLRPFNGSGGNYSAQTVASVAGREVWVPSDFNAKYEAYRFLLPGARIQGYAEERQMDVNELAEKYPLFAVHLPFDAPPCTGCLVLGERLDLRGRHSAVELKDIFRGRAFEELFAKELLLAAPARRASLP